MSHPELLRDAERLWQRAREKLVTAALGRLPDPPSDLQLIRVSCEVAPAALRPLLEARRLTEAILGEARPRQERSKPRVRTLFGDTPERATEAVVADLWNDLARQKGARWVMVFDAVEQADEATLAALVQIVKRPGWVQLPLLLVFHAEPAGPAAELLEAVRARDPEAVLRGDAAPAAAAEADAFEWRTLPPRVLRVLRAGALIGPGFETRTVAELLSLEPLAVLERLQQAIDLGVPVEDRGEGRFSLPTSALTALSASLMPSLAQAWHRQLGRLLGARAAKEAATPPPLPKADAARIAKLRRESVDDPRVAEIIDLSAEVTDLGADAEPAAPTVRAEEAAPTPAPITTGSERGGFEPTDASAGGAANQGSATAAPEAPTSARGWTRVADPYDDVRPAPSVRAKSLLLEPEVDMPAPAAWSPPVQAEATELDDPLIDAVRAAEHMRLAGDSEAAAGHLCEAARKAADVGAPQAAAQHAQAALALLAALPTGPSRRHLKVRALIELARVQWQSAGYDLGFTLSQAQASLDAALAELDASAPIDLAVELAQAMAGVSFDLGDPQSLARALAELERASELLKARGDAIGAACLLNDQAAVRIRMGDPVRALQLLRESRAVFDARGQDDPVALRELAESEHLFARLPLHARMRLGREEEGYAIGIDHARAAERAYRELGDVRELGRVWETMGRLELKRCRIDDARQRLEAAVEVQTQLGDLTGLAQTTEVLSQVLAWCGRNAEAVALLRDSVVFNRDKGSPLGLMFNRRGYSALASRLANLPEHAEGLREVEILLAAGERELGVLQQPE